MLLTEDDNQKAFAEHQYRETICLTWLKELQKDVRQPVNTAAIAGIVNGLGMIAQAAVLVFILQAVIIEKAELNQLLIPFLVLLGITIFRGLCSYFQQTLGFEAGAQVKQTVRKQLFEKIAALGPAYSKQIHSGELSVCVIEQADALENYYSRYLPQQIIAGALPVLIIAIVIPVNWVVAIIFLVTGPLIPVFMALVGMGAANANRGQFLAMARMGGYFLDRLQGITTLKLFGQADREINKIGRVADNFRQQTLSVLRIAFLSSAVLEFFSAVAVALVAVYVGLGLLGLIRFGSAANLNLREALFVLILAPEFFLPLRQLAIFYHDRAAALGASDALLQVLEQPEIKQASVEIATAFSGPLINLHKVGKHFGRRCALQDITLEINHGEKIALLGPSGAGKTTLINLLLGFEIPSTGKILLNGQPLNRFHAARQITWLGQQAYIFYGSIEKNIAIADPHAPSENILQAAEAAGVMEFARQLPDGLQTRVGERGYGLSGGQVQRIALARAFLKQTPVMILDEPTANLDPENRIRLLDDIERLFAEKTLIIATHDKDVMARMSRQIVLQRS